MHHRVVFATVFREIHVKLVYPQGMLPSRRKSQKVSLGFRPKQLFRHSFGKSCEPTFTFVCAPCSIDVIPMADAWERGDGRVGRAGADAGASPGVGPSSTPEARVSESEKIANLRLNPLRSPESSSPGLAAHVQSLGWENREFSDVTVTVFDKQYPLHRLVLSRSSYFSALMRGPWADALSQNITLSFDDSFVTVHAVETCLAFLYDKPPDFATATAVDEWYPLRVLAASTFLDLTALAKSCCDFVIASIGLKNVLRLQNVLDEREWGGDGERVKIAAWGLLTQHASLELKNNLHGLNPNALNKLLTCDELWVSGEPERFALVRRVAAAQAEMTASSSGNCSADAELSAAEITKLVLDDVVSAVTQDEQSNEKKTQNRRRLDDFRVLASAAAFADGIRYQHVSFDNLRCMRDLLLRDEKDVRAAAFRRMARGENDAPCVDKLADEEHQTREIFSLEATRALLDSTPTRLAVEGFWLQTALKSRITSSNDTKWQTGMDTPFRFGVSFPDVANLKDGQGAKHSREAFYAGSFWKISVQAFSDEGKYFPITTFRLPDCPYETDTFFFIVSDPKGRRTLGLFLHRRPAVDDTPVVSAGFRSSTARSSAQDALDGLTETHDDEDGIATIDAEAQPASANRQNSLWIREPDSRRRGSDPQPKSTANHGNSNERESHEQRLGVSHFIDHRDVVDVRYELLCPSRHEIVRLGSLESTAKPTTLPRAPKGWGWRTALLHEDLVNMCDENGALRVVAAIVVDVATRGYNESFIAAEKMLMDAFHGRYGGVVDRDAASRLRDDYAGFSNELAETLDLPGDPQTGLRYW